MLRWARHSDVMSSERAAGPASWLTTPTFMPDIVHERGCIHQQSFLMERRWRITQTTTTGHGVSEASRTSLFCHETHSNAYVMRANRGQR